MNYYNNQKGFAAVEAVLAVMLVGAIGAAGFFAYKLHAKPTSSASAAQPKSTLSTPKSPGFTPAASPLSENGITITSPSDKSSASRSFNITGSVPAGEAGRTIELTIDSNDAYLLPANRSQGLAEGNQVVKINTDGSFSIPVDLNGNNVVALTDNAHYGQKQGVASGQHSFALEIPADENSVIGPTLTLNIQ